MPNRRDMDLNQRRTIGLEVRKVEDDENLLELSFSSEAPVPRWYTNAEILLHDRSAVDLGPLTEVGAVLVNHNPDRAVAVPEKVWVDEESRKGKALIRFVDTPARQEAKTEVLAGLLRGVSVGYSVNERKILGDKDEWRGFRGPAHIVTKWRVHEISLTPIPADATVGVGRTVEDAPEQRREDAMKDKEKVQNVEPQVEVTNGPPPNRDDRDAEVEQERVRVAGILELATRHGFVEQAGKWVADGLSVDQVRAAILDEIVNRQSPAIERPRVEVVEDASDKFARGAELALLARTGLGQEEAGNELNGLTLLELARMALRARNQPYTGNPMDVVGRALTTSDLPNVLGNVANKALLSGYEQAAETWQLWCSTGEVSDFKQLSIPRVSELDDLDLIPELGEYKETGRVDAVETVALATYGKIYGLSRQAIINDDLGALTDAPRAHGEAVARKIGDVAYAQLTSNPVMGDGVQLFHSSHANICSTPGAPGISTIAEAIKLMKKQKGLKGKQRLNLVPQFFIAPVALEGVAEVFFRSERFDDTDKGATTVNPYAGTRFTRVYDPRLDDTSETAWYLAGPSDKTVRVFFLRGQRAPYLEAREGWTVDAVQWKVRIDCAAKAVDWKALVYNAGV